MLRPTSTARFAVLSLLLACNAATPTGASGTASTSGAASTSSSGKANAATLELHVMSKCPYGTKIEKALVPVQEQLGDSLTLSFDYIGKGDAGSLESLHGETEVKGDIAQLCAGKQLDGRLLDFIDCQNRNPREVATNWKDCATELKLDVPALTSCVEGDEGQQLLTQSFARSADKKATGSPTVFLNGQRYTGGRTTPQLMRAICGAMEDGAPQACADLPTPPAVDVVFLSDSRCSTCDLHKVEPKIQGDLAGAKIRYLDYGTPEGKTFYDEIHATKASFNKLPAIFMDPKVKDDKDGYPRLERYLEPVGPWMQLKMKATFDPSGEICDNGIDDDGNGQIDCSDSHCAPQLACRQAIPGKLDLYVMSHCPYGAKALIAADQVMSEFDDDLMGAIDLDVHYIGNGDIDALTSMHGQAEVDDDIREVCAQAEAPDHSLAFAACISRDYKKADWRACADDAGIDADAIDRCFEGHGKQLLVDSFAASQAIGFSSSPTFLVNNQRKFNAVDAVKLQAEICKDNPGLTGCSAQIVSDAASAKPVDPSECK